MSEHTDTFLSATESVEYTQTNIPFKLAIHDNLLPNSSIPQFPVDIALLILDFASLERINAIAALMRLNKNWYRLVKGDEIGWKKRARAPGAGRRYENSSWLETFVQHYRKVCLGCKKALQGPAVDTVVDEPRGSYWCQSCCSADDLMPVFHTQVSYYYLTPFDLRFIPFRLRSCGLQAYTKRDVLQIRKHKYLERPALAMLTTIERIAPRLPSEDEMVLMQIFRLAHYIGENKLLRPFEEAFMFVFDEETPLSSRTMPVLKAFCQVWASKAMVLTRLLADIKRKGLIHRLDDFLKALYFIKGDSNETWLSALGDSRASMSDYFAMVRRYAPY